MVVERMKMNTKDYPNGDIVRFLREYANLIQKDLAKHLRKSVRTVQRYEAGELKIDIETIKSICKLCDLSLMIESNRKKKINHHSNKKEL